MMFQKLGAAALAVGAIFAAPATRAQPVPEPASGGAVADPAVTPSACCTVPARTTIQIVIADPVNSRTARNGQAFAIRLTAPIQVDGRVVVPAGTTGAGEVVHAARARAMGKAGELILAVRYLDLGGRRIPLRSLRYGPAQGRDDSNGVLIGSSVVGAFVPVASVLAFLIAGGEIDIPAGTVAHAMTAAEVVLPQAAS